MTQRLRIGGASGFWGEAPHATAQLLGANVDVLVYDYLAEITMSIMARARQKDPGAGFATDFVKDAMAPNLRDIAQGGVKVLSNAGGVNPSACADALRHQIADAGLSLKVAVVEGDNLLPQAAAFSGEVEMFSGAPMPPHERIASMNAYIGAWPIVAALSAGADIVVTGRCVDSALTLAACLHHFGWAPEDFDRLAAGSLAGHLLECGPQSTGGNFTDWDTVGDLAEIGYPIAEVGDGGEILITKPDGTTGLVTPATIAEQMLYEIGDPQSYHLPDVICDFSEVEITQQGPDRVQVCGARGRAPSGKLKVSTTWADGYRAGMVFQMNGRDARAKAQAFAQAGLDRTRRTLTETGAPDFREISFESFGGRPGEGDYEEIAYKAAVHHDDPHAVGLFLKELIGGALSTPPGLHFFTGGGRPKPSPVVALFSFLVDAGILDYRVTLEGEAVSCTVPDVAEAQSDLPRPHAEPETEWPEGCIQHRLEDLAWARSGDKGDSANIGVITRNPLYLPYIWAALTPEAVAQVFSDELKGSVTRYYLPGTHSMNLVMSQVLGGGGVASLRNDAQGKSFAQRVLSMPVKLPAGLLVNS